MVVSTVHEDFNRFACLLFTTEPLGVDGQWSVCLQFVSGDPEVTKGEVGQSSLV